jgi:hypothetical protein
VGKNELKLRDMTIDASASASHHVFQSRMANFSPTIVPVSNVSLPTPSRVSSSTRLIARRDSSVVSHRVVLDGKSGNMNMAHIAKNIVRAPSKHSFSSMK